MLNKCGATNVETMPVSDQSEQVRALSTSMSMSMLVPLLDG